MGSAHRGNLPIGTAGGHPARLPAVPGRLGDELGIEPGPELRRLEAAVLAQAPSLDRLDAGPAGHRRDGSTGANAERAAAPPPDGR